jgi:hypothetical protein
MQLIITLAVISWLVLAHYALKGAMEKGVSELEASAIVVSLLLNGTFLFLSVLSVLNAHQSH